MSLASCDPRLVRAPGSGDVLYERQPPDDLDADLVQLADQVGRVVDVVSDGITWVGPGIGPDTDAGVRYPVVAGIPLLMADYAHDADGPLERLAGAGSVEVLPYQRTNRKGAAAVSNPMLADLSSWAADPSGFQGGNWMDARFDGPAQLRCYDFLMPAVRGGTICQVGGSGAHAMKFLIAGARRAVAISPILGELVIALVCAVRLGVADRLHLVVGAGEALPLASESVDGIYCGGTLHHMDTALAGREFGRVLPPGGRFAAAEPRQVPVLHRAGTRLLGKREPVYRVPLDRARLTSLDRSFSGTVHTRRHGALTAILGTMSE